MKKTRRFLAVLTAATMMVAPTTVFAAGTATTGGAVGTGGSGGVVVDDNVIDTTLPTVTAGTLDFTLDPDDLLKTATTNKLGESDKSKFKSTTGLCFKNSDGNYTEKSDVIKVEAKAKKEVNVSVEAKVTIASGEGITFVDDANIHAVTDGACSVYLALVDEANAVTTQAVGTDGKASMNATLDPLADNCFDLEYDAAKKGYVYKLNTAGSSAAAEKFEFRLTGACSQGGNWGDAVDMQAKVELTWNLSLGATTAYAMYYPADGNTYLALSEFDADGFASTVFEGTESGITNFKLNGQNCGFSLDGGYILVTPAQSAFANDDAIWTFTFTYNGKDYTAISQ